MDRKLDDATLMRYLDGELGRDEARDAERAVAADPELAAKAKALRQLGGVIAARYDHAADDVDERLAAMWDKLAPQLETKAATGAASAASAAAKKDEGGGFVDWLIGHRSHFLTGAIAAAAGALIATFVARGPAPPTTPAPPPAVALAAAEVESLEVLDGSATVMQIPGAQDGETTTMIWITPGTASAPGAEPDENEGPI